MATGMESDRGVKEMSIEAMKQALAALERGRPQIVGALVQQDQDAAITALRTAIEQAERDWSLLEATQESLREHMAEIKRLKQRQWVGLTNKDIIEMWPETSTVGWDDIRLIEAKLKEKNETT
jgi:chaperonin cofactor prefoldin